MALEQLQPGDLPFHGAVAPFGREVTAIMADDGDRRMLVEPCRDAGSRTIRQEVYDAMCQEIDQDSAIAMASLPGPLVHPKGPGHWSGEDRCCPHQTREGRRTGRQPQSNCEPGPCVP